jgi:hypothetical protein
MQMSEDGRQLVTIWLVLMAAQIEQLCGTRAMIKRAGRDLNEIISMAMSCQGSPILQSCEFIIRPFSILPAMSQLPDRALR